MVRGVFVGNMNASRYDRDNQCAGAGLPRRLLQGRVRRLRLCRRARQDASAARIDTLFEVDAYYIRGDWTLQGQVGGAGMPRRRGQR